MRNKIITAICAVGLMLSFSACNRPGFRIQRLGKPVNIEADIKTPFNSVINQTSADIHLSQGPKKIEVKCAKELRAYLKFSVDKGALVIRQEKYPIGQYKLEIYISNPDFERIISMGSGDIEFDSMRTDNITIVSAGSGDIEGRGLFAADVNLASQGSGDIELSEVSFKSMEAISQGSGDISLKGLEGVSLSCQSQGAGDIKVSGKVESARLNTSGSGDIERSGFQCADLKMSTSGSGEID